MIEKFKLFSKLALRNLRRNSRRTLLTISTISFGLAVLLWVGCILEGRNQNIINKITSGNVGHLQVYNKKYLKDRLLQYTLQEIPQKVAELKQSGAILSRRIQVPSLASSGESSTTVIFQGVEPDTEKQITNLKDHLVEGSFLEPSFSKTCEAKQVLIGKALGELLKIGLGDKLIMMTQTADGSLGSDAYRVKGIFDTHSPDFDKHFVFGNLECVASIANLSGFHEIVVKLTDEKHSLETQQRLNQEVGSDYEVTTWREALPQMATMVKFNNATFTLLSIILFTVISLGIINTLLMSVYERTREFGVMLALGTSPLQLGFLIALESLFLGVLATLVATIIGLAILFYHLKVGFDISPLIGEAHSVNDFQLDMRVYPVIEFGAYLKHVALTLVIVLLAALYPARRASRLNPVESLRHT